MISFRGKLPDGVKEHEIVPDSRLKAFGSSPLEGISEAGIDKIAQSVGINFNEYNRAEFIEGLREEMHRNKNMSINAQTVLEKMRDNVRTKPQEG